jgi:hypothetical protein
MSFGVFDFELTTGTSQNFYQPSHIVEIFHVVDVNEKVNCDVVVAAVVVAVEIYNLHTKMRKYFTRV